MRYLLFSDIHGNLPAFEKVLNEEREIEGYINIGDVVNYGPWSNECVELINSLKNTINILGNHEEYFINGYCDVKNELVQSFFRTTYNNFTKHKEISFYKESVKFDNFILKHTINGKEYIFKDSEVDLDKNLIIGHSHQQYLRLINNNLLINPGSIGQNRKIINVANYIVWNIETGEIQLKNIKYNFNYLISKMRSLNYPIECIEYYTNKSTI